MSKEELIQRLSSKMSEFKSGTDYDEGVRRGLALAISNVRTDEFPPEACDFCSTLMKVEYDGKWCPNCNMYISTKD
jgi:hypothetical protein